MAARTASAPEAQSLLPGCCYRQGVGISAQAKARQSERCPELTNSMVPGRQEFALVAPLLQPPRPMRQAAIEDNHFDFAPPRRRAKV